MTDFDGRMVDEVRTNLNRMARHLRRRSQTLGISSLDVFILTTVYHSPGIGISELAELDDSSPLRSACG